MYLTYPLPNGHTGDCVTGRLMLWWLDGFPPARAGKRLTLSSNGVGSECDSILGEVMPRSRPHIDSEQYDDSQGDSEGEQNHGHLLLGGHSGRTFWLRGLGLLRRLVLADLPEGFVGRQR